MGEGGGGGGGQCQVAFQVDGSGELEEGVFSEKSDVVCKLHAPVHQNSLASSQLVAM